MTDWPAIDFDPYGHDERDDDRYPPLYDGPPEYRPLGKRHGRESARRKKLFAKAGKTLAAIAALRGRAGVYGLGLTRTGLQYGLGVQLDGEREMIWSPLKGYRIREQEPIPF